MSCCVPQAGETQWFEISAAWCRACGKGDVARRVPVVAVQRFPWAGEGFRKMVHVRMPDRLWVVAEGRGRFVD